MAENQLRSLHKMGQILDCFSAIEKRLSAAEISQRTGIPRGTVHRIAATLLELGFLEQERRRDQYQLGLKLLGLGTTVLSNVELHREAQPSIDALRQATGESIHLAVFDGTNSTVINQSAAELLPSNKVFVLTTAPAHACSTGKIALAFQPDAVIERYIGLGLRKVAPKTIVDSTLFREELRVSRERGYAIDDEESGPGTRCVGAPIRNSSGRVFAAVSVSGRKADIDDSRTAAYAELVCHYANAISAELGYTQEV